MKNHIRDKPEASDVAFYITIFLLYGVIAAVIISSIVIILSTLF